MDIIEHRAIRFGVDLARMRFDRPVQVARPKEPTVTLSQAQYAAIAAYAFTAGVRAIQACSSS